MALDTGDPQLKTSHELRLVHAGQQKLDRALDRIVVSVANKMETDVGSLYLFDRRSQSLVLQATVGLLQSCVGRLRMHLHEGLVGLVAERLAPVVLSRATEHPRFKYFPEADEDEYQSFLGVPVLHRRQLRGVLVVQTIDPRAFTRSEINQLTAIASRLAPSLG